MMSFNDLISHFTSHRKPNTQKNIQQPKADGKERASRSSDIFRICRIVDEVEDSRHVERDGPDDLYEEDLSVYEP